MNAEKLKKLQAQVRIGGKGTPRRKRKIVHQTAATDDKKLQSSLKKLSVNTIPGIEEVNMIKDDGTVIHFNNPKAQASLAGNTFAITGHGEHKQIAEMLPGILTQLGPEGLNQLKRLANNVVVGSKLLSSVNEDDDVPNLVENFEDASKKEVEKPVETTTTEVTILEDKPTGDAPKEIETAKVEETVPVLPPVEKSGSPKKEATSIATAVAAPVESKIDVPKPEEKVPAAASTEIKPNAEVVSTETKPVAPAAKSPEKTPAAEAK